MNQSSLPSLQFLSLGTHVNYTRTMEEIYRRPAYPLPWDDIPGFIVYFLLDLVAVIKFSMVMGSAFLILYGIGKCISLIFWALFYKIDKALEKNRVVPGCDGGMYLPFIISCPIAFAMFISPQVERQKSIEHMPQFITTFVSALAMLSIYC